MGPLKNILIKMNLFLHYIINLMMCGLELGNYSSSNNRFVPCARAILSLFSFLFTVHTN